MVNLPFFFFPFFIFAFFPFFIFFAVYHTLFTSNGVHYPTYPWRGLRVYIRQLSLKQNKICGA